MNPYPTQTDVLTTLRVARAQWEAALAALPFDRQTQPGAAGAWSVKDIIAHVTVYEQWLVAWLQAAQRGEFPAPTVLDTPGLEARNTAVYALTRAQTLATTHANAAQNFQALLAVLATFAAEDFTDPARTAWFMQPYWSHKRTIGEAVLNYTLEHYDEHLPSLLAWARQTEPALEEREAVRAILLTPQQETLLLQIKPPPGAAPFWITPGGGVEPNETGEAALRRELREELGLDQSTPGPLVWQRQHTFSWAGKRICQRERYYIVHVERFTPTLSDTLEMSAILQARWWSVAELTQASERFTPLALAQILVRYLAEGAPPEPLTLEVVCD